MKKNSGVDKPPTAPKSKDCRLSEFSIDNIQGFVLRKEVFLILIIKKWKSEAQVHFQESKVIGGKLAPPRPLFPKGIRFKF